MSYTRKDQSAHFNTAAVLANSFLAFDQPKTALKVLVHAFKMDKYMRDREKLIARHKKLLAEADMFKMAADTELFKFMRENNLI